MKEHRKKQKVQDAAVEEAVQGAGGAGTALATQSTGASPLFGKTVASHNAKLFLGCVKNALEDPLSVSRLADFPEMGVSQQRDLLFHCKQRVPFQYSVFSFFFFFFFDTLFAGSAGI